MTKIYCDSCRRETREAETIYIMASFCLPSSDGMCQEDRVAHLCWNCAGNARDAAARMGEWLKAKVAAAVPATGVSVS